LPYLLKRWSNGPSLCVSTHQLKVASLDAFKQVLLHDGTSFAVHQRLAADFSGRFKTISPAAIECHMIMSLPEQSPLCMSPSADTAGDRQFLPEAHKLANCCWLTRVILTGLGLSR
jgi:hypothetical protein